VSIIAARAVVEQVTEQDLRRPGHILEASLHVAERIATCIFDQGRARVARPHDIGAPAGADK
jgi:malate dehydrogenase (oxaloacetate-decarboxylating)(NADP+)